MRFCKSNYRKIDSPCRICKQSIQLLIAIISVSVFTFSTIGRASDPYLESSTLVQTAKYQLTPLMEPRIDTSPRKEWNIELTTRMVARQDRVATSLLETTTWGFTVWDTRMLFRSRNIPSLLFATGVENIFNRRYREHFDFRTASGLSVLQPGANFYVSTSLSF